MHSGADVANAALMYNAARFSLTGGDEEQPEVMVCLCLAESEEEKERNKAPTKNRSLPGQTAKMTTSYCLYYAVNLCVCF